MEIQTDSSSEICKHQEGNQRAEWHREGMHDSSHLTNPFSCFSWSWSIHVIFNAPLNVLLWWSSCLIVDRSQLLQLASLIKTSEVISLATLHKLALPVLSFNLHCSFSTVCCKARVWLASKLIQFLFSKKNINLQFHSDMPNIKLLFNQKMFKRKCSVKRVGCTVAPEDGKNLHSLPQQWATYPNQWIQLPSM